MISKKTLLMILVGVIFLSCEDYDLKHNNPAEKFNDETVTDIDGNVYHTVQIGTQTWMVENLKTTRYRNGDVIPPVTDNTAWSNLTIGAYCNYDNNASNATAYGRLYNWYAVYDSRNIAPAGWHVPTDNDWQILVDYLGGSIVAGGKLKEAGTTHWASPNTAADNSNGFTALPGGDRLDDGTFNDGMGYDGHWWSSTERIAADAWHRSMYYDGANVYRSPRDKESGFSIRCVRD